ncbi:MAG: hypothetical protein CL623_01910 [Arcobacter sp.]|nr:hypothetical protein [Arcobacter sp.]|tara:strand:+ start:4663 stop:6462 length:1800 start_codon:yes stop_codon:yes gene_type:complete
MSKSIEKEFNNSDAYSIDDGMEEHYKSMDKEIRENYDVPEDGFDNEDDIETNFEPVFPTEAELNESNKALIEKEAKSHDLVSSLSSLNSCTPNITSEFNNGGDTESYLFKTEVDDTEEDYLIKTNLNKYLVQIKPMNKTTWNIIATKLESPKGIGESLSSDKQIYKTGGIKVLKKAAKDNDWKFGEKDDKKLIYTGRYWTVLSQKYQLMFIQSCMIKLSIPGILVLDNQFLEIFFKQFISNHFFKEIRVKAETRINLLNGTLRIDLDGAKLLPHHPNSHMTHLMDYSYDSRATNSLFLSFLDMVLPDKNTQKTLQQAIAYLFIQGLKLEMVIFLFGTGSNGKSVIFEVLKGIISSNMMTNYSLESLVDSKGYHRYNIQNKLMNYATDISMKHIKHGTFKQLASGEPLEARLPGNDPVIMDNYAKLIFNINKIDDADIESTIGFFRRMVFVPFEVTITRNQQDKELPKKILQNKAGILNWIIEGAVEVLNNQSIFISHKCSKFLDRFQKDSNITARFYEECLIPSSTDRIRFQDMYNLFLNYCKRQGEKPIPQIQFKTELRKHNLSVTRAKSGMVWLTGLNHNNLHALSIIEPFNNYNGS